MMRLLCLFMAITILFIGCTPSKVIQSESPAPSEELEEPSETLESMEEIEGYRTLLSQDNKLSIVRKPATADYSKRNAEKMAELPKYNPNSSDLWQVDLRSNDLTNLDLTESLDNLVYADFDSKTKWPDNLPDGFEPEMIMELGKNPGLGIRELHKSGITGKGVGIAIIDQVLLVDHIEYKDQLKLYEEIYCSADEAQMHGPAVASIAVGKTVGVAPEADLYYIATSFGIYNNEGFTYELSWVAKAIDRIVEINRALPEEKKIRVISISLGIGNNMNGYKEALRAIEDAKKEGIYTLYVGSRNFRGLGRDPLKDSDDIMSYSRAESWNEVHTNDYLLVPMDSRCYASPTGSNDYTFSRKGGISWTVPYVAGLYALACQVNPEASLGLFWQEAISTSDTISLDNNNEEKLGKIINPSKLIRKIKEMK
mgnify:CR=1 FL=1